MCICDSILEVAQVPIAINFHMVFGVIDLGECHVDGKFPLIPLPQVPPLNGVHGGVSGDSPIHLDRTWAGFGSYASASLYHSVISRVLDIVGHDESFVGPVPFIGVVKGVLDIDTVEECNATVRCSSMTCTVHSGQG